MSASTSLLSKGGSAQRRIHPAILPSLILAFMLFFVSSCTSPYINYGVLLWAPSGNEDAGIGNGDFVGIKSSSDIRNIFTVQPLPETGAEPIDLERWRVRVFSDREEAEAYAQEYAQFSQVYARSQTQGLPIRISDDNLSTMIYRLRRDETVKVLLRQEEETNLSGLVDYWYQVLTETGITGWVFGYNLDVLGGSLGQANEQDVQKDELLEGLFNYQWKPEYYLGMIRDKQYDLQRFTTGYGLFADREAKTIRLSVPEENIAFTYQDLFNPRYGQYLADGTSLQITIHSSERITVQYEVPGRVVARGFIRITESIPDLIQAELGRRRQVYQDIVMQGVNYVSSVYGRITLNPEEPSFSWQGFESLDPSLRSQGFSGQGRLAFDRYLGPSLRNEFTGVVSMLPEAGENWQRITWLYTITQAGIRFEFLDIGEPGSLSADRRALSPFIMFFESLHDTPEAEDAAGTDQ